MAKDWLGREIKKATKAYSPKKTGQHNTARKTTTKSRTRKTGKK